MSVLQQAQKRVKDGLPLCEAEWIALAERNEALEVGFAVQAAVLEDKTAEVERLKQRASELVGALLVTGSLVDGEPWHTDSCIWRRSDSHEDECDWDCNQARAALIAAGALTAEGKEP